MPIYEATYTISNVGSSNFISLSNNDINEVVACLDPNIPGSKWNIIPLCRSNTYHIQNDQLLYAWRKIAARGESTVVGSRRHRTEWVIKETNESDHYIISPADDDEVFWGLEDNKRDTPVELKMNGPNLRNNHWQFHHHSRPRIVEDIIDDLQLTLDWVDTTTTQVPFKAHASGTLRRSDLPPDASVSFPKPMSMIWNRLIIARAETNATFGASQADERADNFLVTPTADDDIMSDFFRALLKEKSVCVELQVEEVTVHTGHKVFPSIRTSLRKSIAIGGFYNFKDQVSVEKIRITGSDPSGNSLTARTDISIRSLSNVSLRIDELPVEVYYCGLKMADLIVPGPFKLYHRSSGKEFRALEIPVKFQPENSHDRRCKEFIEKYIATGESIEISISIEKTVIKLASSAISIPRFTVISKVDGMDRQFITGVTAYFLIRKALTKKIDFTFDFENPIDTSVTITFIKGEASRKMQPICRFQKEMKMTTQAHTTSTSEKMRKASFYLTWRSIITFLGKREIKLDINVQSVNISIGKFHISDLTFEKLRDVKVRLKWSLPLNLISSDNTTFSTEPVIFFLNGVLLVFRLKLSLPLNLISSDFE